MSKRKTPSAGQTPPPGTPRSALNPLPAEVWIRVSNCCRYSVSTEGCDTVGRLIEALYARYNLSRSQDLSISLSDGPRGAVYDRGDLLSAIRLGNLHFGLKHTWTSTTFSKVEYTPHSHFVRLSADHTRGLGGHRSLILYCRPAFHEQIAFVEEHVILNAHLGMIDGPPGNGKSSASIVHGYCLAACGWCVTFVQLRHDMKPEVTQLEGSSKRVYPLIDLASLESILSALPDNGKSIVFVDGLRITGSLHADYLRVAKEWRVSASELQCRRLVTVSSLQAIRVHGREFDADEKRLVIHSWSKDEYAAALANPDFLDSVKGALDAHSSASATVTEMLDAKYYLAGGCARAMWSMNSSEVNEYIQQALDTLDRPLEYIDGRINPRSVEVTNRLLASKSHPSGSVDSGIISRNAMDKLSSSRPLCIRQLVTISGIKNRAFLGIAFEMSFWIDAVGRGIVAVDRSSGITETWAGVPLVEFDPCTGKHPSVAGVEVPMAMIIPPLAQLPMRFVLKPADESQAGYDAVYVDRTTGYVRLVQVTMGQSHDFKAQPFADFLDKFAETFGMAYSRFEIVFLVDRVVVNTFRITRIQNRGALVNHGWNSGNELSNVRIMGTEGVLS